ncbi:MAG: hypothetical protein ACXWFI_08460 [Methylobacter sp.]
MSIIQPIYAEGTGATPRHLEPTIEHSSGVKATPPFPEVDKNGDHYVTKDELKDYPYLLEHFDSVDAGKDGKLEEHEYENLYMEKEREKGR